MVILGIDPGLSGGIAILNGDLPDVLPMPVIDAANGKGHALDTQRIGTLVRIVANHGGRAVIERQQAMPKQGITSTGRP